MESDDSTSPGPATGKHKSMSRESKKSSPDPSRCLMSPVKKLSALRLVSPFDTDQDPIDLEVATVLADGGMVSPTKPKSQGTTTTPVRPATVMTNVQRGNVQTTTPLLNTASLTIHQLAAQGELNSIKLEVEHGTEIDSVDEYGLTPLLWACAFGQLITVKYLLDLNVSLDAVGQRGENAVLYACCYGYHEILYLLLQLDMDVNYTDVTESTGLMYAAYNNHVTCVKQLLDHGADMTLQNEDGNTAMDLAVGQNHKAVQQAFEAHMLKLFESLT